MYSSIFRTFQIWELKKKNHFQNHLLLPVWRRVFISLSPSYSLMKLGFLWAFIQVGFARASQKIRKCLPDDFFRLSGISISISVSSSPVIYWFDFAFLLIGSCLIFVFLFGFFLSLKIFYYSDLKSLQKLTELQKKP